MNQTEAKKPTKFLGMSKNVISLGVVSFLNDVSSDMIFPFIPIFLTNVLGASVAFVGLIEGVAETTASVCKAAAGRISDTLHSRKPLIVFGYSLSALSKPLLAIAASPWHVLAVRFFDRVGKGTRDAPRDSLLSISTKKKSFGRVFGFHRGADTLGAAVGPVIAFALLPLLDNNLRHLFALSFVASFFAVILIIFFVKDVKQNITHDSRSSKKTKAIGSAPLSKLGISFFIFLTAATILSLGKVSEAFLLLRAQGLGMALALLPLLYFVYNITLALFSWPAGALSDRIGHRNTYMIGMLIFSGTYFLFATVTAPHALWILFALLGFYAAFTEGVGRAIVADLVHEDWRGTGYGLYNACTGFAALPASIVFGVLWDAYGPATSFLFGSLLGIIALIVFLCLRFARYWYKQLTIIA